MYYGWLQDSIWDLTNSKWDVFSKFPYCLVTCIDSNFDVKSTITARRIVESEGFCNFLGSSLVIGDGRLLDVVQRYGLFSHFDEIWLYKHRPTMELPEVVGLASPFDLSTEEPPRELLDWFETSGCQLGLGDGMGMNYMTNCKEIVELLEARQREFDSEDNRENYG